MRKFGCFTSLLQLLLVGLITGSVLAQTGGGFRITGTVVNGNDGSLVPRCHLVATRVERRGAGDRSATPQGDAVTDDDGHFAMAVPSAGSWSLRASSRGYRSQTFDEHDAFSSAIVLTPEAPSIDLVYRLMPDAVVTGVVLDEAGEPVRTAQVALYAVSPAGVAESLAPRIRANATTDDRGRYELAGLGPGDYRLSVQAQPWYAVAAQPRRFQSGTAAPVEPSLDVVYPVTWFPGGTDPEAAATITLHAGETRQADLQLQPIPSVHLRMSIPQPVAGGSNDQGRRPLRFPQVEAVSPGGGNGSISTSTNSQGQVDFGGLAPGLYRVRFPDEPGQPERSSLVQITAGSARTLDLANAASTATVTIKFAGAVDAGTVVTMIDADNPQNIFRTNSAGGRRSLLLRHQDVTQQTAGESTFRTLDVPPGRYLVYQNAPNAHLTGITFAGKYTASRMVSVVAGESSLTLHVSTGRATVHGLVRYQDKASVGAMVLLVPISLDEPGHIAEVRRDQTNTDGSFDISDVIPGRYIVIAIDHGWHVNWSDSATLRHYLTQGVPLDLKPSADVTQDLIAQSP